MQFSIVITTDLPEKPLLKLADTLWNAKIPLVIVRTVGFIGYFRIALAEHTSEIRLNDLYNFFFEFY